MPPTSKAEPCTVGMASWVKKARSTCRITSVAITLFTPSRLASIEAIVDLPTPVVPPSSTTSGRSSRSSRRQLAYLRAVVSSCSVRSTSSASACRSAVRISPPSSRSSITRASSKARPGDRPVAEIARAISPFEYGRPWPLWRTMVSREGAGVPAPDRSFPAGGISVQGDECVVDSDWPVADEHHACALGAGANRDCVDRRGLQLREVEVSAVGCRAVEIFGEGAALRQVGGDEHRVGDAVHLGGAGGEDGHPRVLRHVLERLGPKRERQRVWRWLNRSLRREDEVCAREPVLRERLGRSGAEDAHRAVDLHRRDARA